LNYLYLAGWDNTKYQDAFVLARSSIQLGSALPPNTINSTTDTVNAATGLCYDQFDEKRHPDLYLFNNYLIILITGKCSRFFRIALPATNVPWSSVIVDNFDATLGQAGTYVSAASLDPDTGIIYYTIKLFNIPTAAVYSYNAATWSNPMQVLNLDDMERDSDLLTVIAKSVTTKWLIIVGAGSERIERYTIQSGGTLTGQNSAYLEDEIMMVSSLLYYDPYLFFTTYEPDAKIARIHMDNFCSSWCTNNGYCLQGSCICSSGYVSDPVAICVPARPPPSFLNQEGAVVGLSIFTAILVVTAIAGWVMWYRGRGYVSIK